MSVWQRLESRSTPGSFYFWHQQSGFTELEDAWKRNWERRESQNQRGVYYYYHTASRLTQSDPPWPWELRQSASLGCFCYYNVLTQTRSVVKPNLAPSDFEPVSSQVVPVSASLARPLTPSSEVVLQEKEEGCVAHDAADAVLRFEQEKASGEEGGEIGKTVEEHWVDGVNNPVAVAREVSGADEVDSSSHSEEAGADSPSDSSSSSSVQVASSSAVNVRRTNVKKRGHVENQRGPAKKTKKTCDGEKPLLMYLALRPSMDDRVSEFFTFMLQAIMQKKNQAYDYPFADTRDIFSDFCLGGYAILLPDVIEFAQLFLTEADSDIQEILWKAAMAIWLGTGGQGMQTLKHLTSDFPLFGHKCPLEYKLQQVSSKASLGPMYEYIKTLSKNHGVGKVFGGDGTAVKMRLYEGARNAQGLQVLQQWRESIQALGEKLAHSECVGSESQISPRDIAMHFCKCRYFGDLCIKELFCYMYPKFPKIFDPVEYITYGTGAKAGGFFIFGGSGKKDMHRSSQQMLSSMLEPLRNQIIEAGRAAIKRLGRGLQALPGYQLKSTAGADPLDVEVCLCWFQSATKSKHQKRRTAPASWHNFKRDKWRVE